MTRESKEWTADRLKELLDDIVSDVRDRAPALYEEAVAAAKDKDKSPPNKGDFDQFGIAVFTAQGACVSAGNAGVSFPIQSISKLFALEVALAGGGETLWDRVGREPSGDPFNSIIDLERLKGIPRNPFINAGALVVCDALVSMATRRKSLQVVDFVQQMLDGEQVALDDGVVDSGKTGGHLNRSLMSMAKHHGNLDNDLDAVMDAYATQCAIQLDARGLARAGRFLMHDDATEGPDEERGIAAAKRARRIMALMMLCGQYDGSGEFAYRVGLPAKSGVGGGILAIAPHRASIAVFSPALDPMGNSWLGTLGLELLTDRTDWSVFGSVKTLG